MTLPFPSSNCKWIYLLNNLFLPYPTRPINAEPRRSKVEGSGTWLNPSVAVILAPKLSGMFEKFSVSHELVGVDLYQKKSPLEPTVGGSYTLRPKKVGVGGPGTSDSTWNVHVKVSGTVTESPVNEFHPSITLIDPLLYRRVPGAPPEPLFP